MDRGLEQALKSFGVSDIANLDFGRPDSNGPPLAVRSPIDGSLLAELPTTSVDSVEYEIGAAVHDFPAWRDTPAPVRGEFVRRVRNKLRERQQDLAIVVAWETGKILPEARGEVQEMIDI